MSTDNIAKAIRILGGQRATARILDVSQPAICKWASGKTPIPIDACFLLEWATGNQVTAEELRPDFFVEKKKNMLGHYYDSLQMD